MSTRIATARATGGAMECCTTVNESLHQQLHDHPPCLVMVCASTRQPLAEVMPRMHAEWPGAVVMGCSTAGEFTQEAEGQGALVVFALSGDFHMHAGMGSGLNQDVESAARQAVGTPPPLLEDHPHRTGILLMDGLAGVGEEATLTCASLLGESVKLAGGAAGDDWLVRNTWVGLGERVETNALVLATLSSRTPLGLGVCHGHLPFGEPLRVTRSEGNVVHQFNNLPAWDAFLKVARPHALVHSGVDPAVLTDGGDLLKFFAHYQTCLTHGLEYTVRTPLLRTPEGGLAFACGIPEGTVVHVALGSMDQQVESARLAARSARMELDNAPPAGALVFECACRNVLLGSRFAEAPRAIVGELAAPVAGPECYGEVAMNAGELSGFHNSTTVVLAFPRE